MRPCYNCKRFNPNARPLAWWGEPNPNCIGGCNGNGTQFDPEITAPDLGMFCDLFDPKESIESGATSERGLDT